jgi:signal transduction histidine kinase
LWYVAVVVVTTTGLAAAGVWFARQSVTGAADATLRAQLEGVQQFIETTTGALAAEDVLDEFHEYAQLTLGRALLQVSSAGVDFCKPSIAGWDRLVAGLVAPSGDASVFQSASIGREPYRAVTATTTVRGRPYRVTAAVPMASADDTMRRFQWLLAGLLPGVWLVAAAAGFALSRRALAPVDRMTREVQALTVKHLDRRVALPAGDDEVTRLAATFNDMLARLESAVDEMAQLTGEASHELRTPVALIRATAEVALSQDRPAADYRQALADILAHAERMSGLVGDLLLLARADAGVEPSEARRVDLRQVALRAARAAEPAAAQRGVSIDVHATEPVAILGGEDALGRLLAILIDNALKYTNTGGAVRVEVGIEDHAAALDVVDTGIGIAPDERERVFERFYRTPSARERADGAGLGLAIARTIVTRYRGRIDLAPGADGKGTRVRVRFAVADASEDSR